MIRVEELEQAITQLPPEDFRRLAHWILERDNERWDAQMAQDAASGKLDALFAEANEPAAP